MTVKVEMRKREEEGIIAFAFEASTEAELEVVDALVEVMFGTYKKEGGFVNARRFAMHVHDPLLKDPKPEPVAKARPPVRVRP